MGLLHCVNWWLRLWKNKISSFLSIITMISNYDYVMSWVKGLWYFVVGNVLPQQDKRQMNDEKLKTTVSLTLLHTLICNTVPSSPHHPILTPVPLLQPSLPQLCPASFSPAWLLPPHSYFQFFSSPPQPSCLFGAVSPALSNPLLFQNLPASCFLLHLHILFHPLPLQFLSYFSQDNFNHTGTPYSLFSLSLPSAMLSHFSFLCAFSLPSLASLHHFFWKIIYPHSSLVLLKKGHTSDYECLAQGYSTCRAGATCSSCVIFM